MILNLFDFYTFILFNFSIKNTSEKGDVALLPHFLHYLQSASLYAWVVTLQNFMSQTVLDLDISESAKSDFLPAKLSF